MRKVGGSLHQCLWFLQLALDSFFMRGDSFRSFCVCLHCAAQSCYHMHVCSTSRMIFLCKAECAVEHVCSSTVLAVLCTSIFPRHVVVLVFNAGMCCRAYAFARAEMFSFVSHSEKQAHFEGHYLAPLFGPTFGTQRKSPGCA